MDLIIKIKTNLLTALLFSLGFISPQLAYSDPSPNRICSPECEGGRRNCSALYEAESYDWFQCLEDNVRCLREEPWCASRFDCEPGFFDDGGFYCGDDTYDTPDRNGCTTSETYNFDAQPYGSAYPNCSSLEYKWERDCPNSRESEGYRDCFGDCPSDCSIVKPYVKTQKSQRYSGFEIPSGTSYGEF